MQLASLRRPVVDARFGEEGDEAERFNNNSAGRRATASLLVLKALTQAEEHYLIAPNATLGTWFARVQETVSVASRVTVGRIEEGGPPLEEEVAREQVGLLADICAEAIRAVRQIWPGFPAPSTENDLFEFAAVGDTQMSWTLLLISLARCSAALEPVANGLRDRDLPIDGSVDCEVIADSFQDVAGYAFGAVYSLCGCVRSE